MAASLSTLAGLLNFRHVRGHWLLATMLGQVSWAQAPLKPTEEVPYNARYGLV